MTRLDRIEGHGVAWATEEDLRLLIDVARAVETELRREWGFLAVEPIDKAEAIAPLLEEEA